MGIAASELCRYVIRPTLMYLGRHNQTAESLLLGIAASQSELGSALHDRRGHGLYSITESRHRALWDDYLALDPDRASLVRGLASQHAFLSAPQLELTVNLRYATAVAWLLVEQHNPALPPPGDVLAMARIWKESFHPQGRLRDFTQAWQTCVSPMIPAVC
ncbi:hypothetical protein [Pseudomonas extremaustralis]|uniref:Uncharacterized protein n=1 Tax=Pseudomonas extremaustralis TaxID=359110 RepID=A0A5C5QI69_9PSED|nr:hypothetical protein [Pseudomonas extremaustralis]EZI29144.1 hypothetical protein PE143B_0108500 [Pseudomonas extremaustralis 14-3 substr. 14-3b]TWS04974.1 hypothetical protein FIV36_10865 [Pseudomonas extremaustralis]SDE56788.1 hypothetical protein SAMN05216591_0217 [Pseudomonas extremaustralis]